MFLGLSGQRTASSGGIEQFVNRPQVVADLAQRALNPVPARGQLCVAAGTGDRSTVRAFLCSAPGHRARARRDGIFDAVEPPFTNESPRACDRISLCVKEVFDVSQRLDVGRRVIPMA